MPSIRCVRPSASAARPTSPASMQDRTYVEDQRHVVVAQQRHPLGREAEPPPASASERDVAGALVAEAEVLPHHDRGCVQALDEHRVHELGRAQPAELGGERQHAHDVDAELLEQVGLARRPVSTGGWLTRAGRPRSGAGRRSRTTLRHAELAGPLDRPADDPLVTAVDAVEDADRHHAPAPARRRVVDPPPALHATTCLPRVVGSACAA